MDLDRLRTTIANKTWESTHNTAREYLRDSYELVYGGLSEGPRTELTREMYEDGFGPKIISAVLDISLPTAQRLIDLADPKEPGHLYSLDGSIRYNPRSEPLASTVSSVPARQPVKSLRAAISDLDNAVFRIGSFDRIPRGESVAIYARVDRLLTLLKERGERE